MTERSPTPWFVHDFTQVPGFTDPLPVDVTISCDHPATITIANMDRGMTATLEEARANAAFIVHAVNLHDEMVGALRDMETYLDSYIDELTEAGIHAAYSRNMLARLRDVLSKSTPTQEGE